MLCKVDWNVASGMRGRRMANLKSRGSRAALIQIPSFIAWIVHFLNGLTKDS